MSALDELDLGAEHAAPSAQPPMPELTPDPSQGPDPETEKEKYFANMTARQQAEYGGEYAILHVPSGIYYAFDKHKARNPECQVVDVALYEEQMERERVFAEKLARDEFEQQVEAELGRKRAELAVEDEVQRRLKVERKRAPKPVAPAAPAPGEVDPPGAGA